MKVVYLAIVIFPYFQLGSSSFEDNASSVQKGVLGKNNFASGRSVVVPLLDIGVLWAEDKLVRNKRKLMHHTTKTPFGFIRSLMQHAKEKENQTDSSDAFVDSLVSMMSKSDPGLLLKLQSRIEEFEGHRPRKFKKQEKQRPLIQFFNVTRISVSSDDDDDAGISLGETSSLSKMENSVIHPGKKQERKEISIDEYNNVNNGIGPEVTELVINPKTDITTFLKTKDGQIARIQRSKDRRRYRLEIDYTTDASQEGDNGTDERQAERRKRTIKYSNQNPETERFIGHWQDIIGSSSNNTLVKHSFPLEKGPKLSYIA